MAATALLKALAPALVTAQLLWPAPTSAEPPPGFEDLNQPETALVDVYFQDQLIGQYLATFAAGWIAFERPAEVVDDVPGIGQPGALQKALSGQLDTHADRLCRPGQSDCGFVDTDTAAVLFSRGQFRVDLNVAADLLESEATGPQFLDPPPAEPSFVQSLAAAGSGTTGQTVGDNPVGTVRSLSVLGFGAGRLRVESSASTVDALALDTAYAEVDRKAFRFQGGAYRATPVPTIGQRRIIGAGVTSTLDLRTDISRAPGTPLIVTLQRRAVVEILRDGRVLDSRVYSAGTQRLETQRLPPGAYDVTIRISQVGGGTRTLQRFFVKDELIPPTDQPFYTFNVGVLADNASPGLPNTGEPLIHGAHRRQLVDGLGAGLDLAATETEAAGEFTLANVNPFGQIQASAFASTDLDYGATVRTYGQTGNVNYSAQIRQLWVDETDQDVQTRDVRELVPDQRAGTTLDLALDYLFEDGGSVGIFADFRRSRGFEDDWSYGPTVRYPLYNEGGLSIGLNAEASVGRTETVAFLSFRVTWSSDRTTASSEGGYRYSDRPGESTAFGDVTATYQAIDQQDRQLNLGVGATQGLNDAVRTDADYRGPSTRAELALERNLSEDPSTSYAGTVSTNVVGDPNGVSLVGNENYLAAIMIDVEEAPAEATFDVLVDDRRRAEVTSGNRVSVPLEPYDRYKVRLRRKGGSFLDYDTRTRTVTVFPGNVRTLRWETATVVSVFGQIVRPDGTPVANKLIEGPRTRLRTDDLGYFQAEIGTSEQLTIARGTPNACRVALPDLPPEAEFRDLGELTCTPLPN